MLIHRTKSTRAIIHQRLFYANDMQEAVYINLHPFHTSPLTTSHTCDLLLLPVNKKWKGSKEVERNAIVIAMKGPKIMLQLATS